MSADNANMNDGGQPGAGDQQGANDGANVATEREARVQGWVPLEDFRGREEDWVDAGTFVERGKQINAILRRNNQRLVEQTVGLQRELDGVKQTIGEFREYHMQTEKRAYERAMTELQAQRAALLEDGETAKALEVGDKISDLRAAERQQQVLIEQHKQTQQQAPASNVPDSPDLSKMAPEFRDWIGQNEWFGADQVKTQLVLAVGGELRREMPHLQGMGFLTELESRLSQSYPRRFTEFGSRGHNPYRDSNRHESGDGGGPQPSRKKTARDLPQDAREAMQRFVGQKLMTEEQYLNEYFSQ